MVPGIDAARAAVRNGEARLAVFAADASPEQLGKIEGLLRHRGVPVRWVTTRAELGRTIGRGSTSALVVTVLSFAEKLMQLLPADAPLAGRPEGEAGPQEESGFDAGC